MKRLSITLIVIISIVISATAQTKGNAKDTEAVKNIALKWQDDWNRHDMKALAALVAEDVDFITVGGVWQKNQKEFEEYHAKGHAMQFKESAWTTKNTTVKFIKSDVAVAHVEWAIKGDKDPDGTPRQPRQGIFTWVLEKRKGNWLIIAAQNTNIREPVILKSI
jgi:uncharacterized protein (TIGR02246 family)